MYAQIAVTMNAVSNSQDAAPPPFCGDKRCGPNALAVCYCCYVFSALF